MLLQLLLLCVAAYALPSHPSCASSDGLIIGLGHDIGTHSNSSLATCCATCQANTACAAWTFHADSGVCWLHSSTDGVKHESGATSGVPGGVMPPLPPAPAPMGSPSGPDACTPGTNGTSFKYCDASLSLEQRVDALVALVELEEIASQLTARQSEPIDRIGLPSYYWGTNAIHGMQNVDCLNETQCPTSFPAPCSLSATFNMSLTYEMGNIIGRELRAYYNAKVHNSLDTWSPTININRDPRWGRNVESPGEDPMLAGEYGTAYTQGLQQYSGEEQVVQAVVTLKHFLAYSIENYHGVQRYNVDVKVSAYDMANTYQPAWETLVKKGKALGIMCSYNAVNGLPTCGNPALNATLREDWGFEGYMTSDSDSCQCIIGGHPQGDGGPPRPTNGTGATKQCLLGGTDIDSGGTYGKYLAAAVQSGELQERWARLGLRNSYRMRAKMGLLDPSKPSKYKQIGTEEVGCAAHQAASLLAAQKGMVLLKRGVLPFGKGKHVAVIGQAANDTMSLTGNYDGPLCPGGGAACWPSIAQAVQSANTGGTTAVLASTDPVQGAAVAKGAEQVVLVLDNFKDGGGEGKDRVSVALSAAQRSLAEAVIKANSNTAVVLVNGGMISLDDLVDKAPAILEAFMPGVHGGTAIAQTVFGDNNPGGKLPVSMYHSSYVNYSNFLNMSMVNRTYRYYTGQPSYEFGYGESYTEFALSWGAHPPEHTVRGPQDPPVQYKLTVRNTGPRAGDEVLLAFLRPQGSSMQATLLGAPVERKRLLGFERVHLQPGEAQELLFRVRPEQLGMVDGEGHTSLHPGQFVLEFSRGHGAVLQAPVTVQPAAGVPIRIKSLRKWW